MAPPWAVIVVWSVVLLALGALVSSTENATSNSSDCQRVESIPYCGQYVTYAINGTKFPTDESLQIASDAVFSDYVSYLQHMVPLFERDDFDTESWQARCQVYIAYYFCLQKFPACIDDELSGGTYEVGVCQFACEDYRQFCDTSQYILGLDAVPEDLYNPAGSRHTPCENLDGPGLECSPASKAGATIAIVALILALGLGQ